MSNKKIYVLLFRYAVLIILGIFLAACNRYVTISPTVCDMSAGCEVTDPITDADTLLTKAKANVVLVLGASDWGVLETCEKKSNGNKNCFFGGGTKSEPCTCQYNLKPLEGYLDAFAKDREREVLLQLSPIFTARRTVPPYLENTPFGSPKGANPEMIAAFKNLWDQVQMVLTKPKYEDIFFFISVGNEVNVYLNSKNKLTPVDGDVDQSWIGYEQFFIEARKYIRSRFRRGVGVTTTWYGYNYYGNCGFGDEPKLKDVCKTQLEKLRSLYNLSDYIVITYYPFYNNDIGAGADQASMQWAIEQDFAKMDSLSYEFGDKLVFVQEAGYPSGSDLLQSKGEIKQDWFVDAVFDAWENDKNRIVFLNYFHLHDFSSTVARGWWKGCSNSQECKEIAGAYGILPTAVSCNLKTKECVIDKICNNDSQCYSETGNPLFVCCTNKNLCQDAGAQQRCVLPTACDFATAGLAPLPLCPGGMDKECKTDFVCGSNHLCLPRKIRESVCTWGLRKANGKPKPAWNTFLKRARSTNP